jgi:tRNA-splicing ligase RtcB (3'-phosphate/5'-hydroxy nucleic acid ligase)
VSDRLKVFGQHDDNTIAQMEACITEDAVKGVLCADGHKGYSQPVGGVVAYRDKISISGVGFDIGCGNTAIKTDASFLDVQFDIGKIMDRIASEISFGVGRVNDTRVDDPLFDDHRWTIKAISPFKEMARQQLGTVGSGNHYVDLFVDESDFIWVGVHFGSRGFGHKTATAFLKTAGGKDGMDVPPTLVPDTGSIGADYIECMKLAGTYARAGRDWVASYVTIAILGASSLDYINNHHNFAWKEGHNGEEMWVIRKGATPAFPGQRGFVGGSMGDNAVIIEGIDSDESKASLYSTVHGAGRVMSRTEAKGKKGKPGKVSREEMQKWISDKGVCLRGADLDEAPQAYRRLSNVLKEHGGTIKILHTLRPIGVAMAGDVYDPYKD